MHGKVCYCPFLIFPPSHSEYCFLSLIHVLTIPFSLKPPQGRHLFSADTLPDMKDWIRRLQAALEQIRNNNRPAAVAAAATTSTASSMSAGKESGKKRKEESSSSVAETREDRENHTTSSTTKDRKKKKEVRGRGKERMIYKYFSDCIKGRETSSIHVALLSLTKDLIPICGDVD